MPPAGYTAGNTQQTMRCVLSYFKDYFSPTAPAPLANHSAGQIARHLHKALTQFGAVSYYDAQEERPARLFADVFIGHFWTFADICRQNSFKTKIAFYSVSDPERTRSLLFALAAEFDVPPPEWDLPPATFDHRETLELADLVLVVGNSYTLQTFPAQWRHKIRLLNYSVDAELYGRATGVERRAEFCYAATHCGLRKGFMDVLRTWREIDANESRLHAVGRLDETWARLLQQHNRGSIVYHGWIDSHTDAYLRLLQSCKFAHVPTYSEGQMGTLLEVIYSGCIPVTTRAAGIDDRVLEHCLVVEPRNIEQQRQAIRLALDWSQSEYEARRDALLAAARAYHNWTDFEREVASVIQTAFAGKGNELH